MSFDVTALCPDSTWTPTVTKDDLLATVEGFDERIVNIARDLDMDTVNVRAVYDIDPVDTWHSDSVVLIGDAAHSMLHHQGQGANSAILDAGALADALAEADSVKDALALYQADPQAGDGRAAAHLASGVDARTRSTTSSRARSPRSQQPQA